MKRLKITIVILFVLFNYSCTIQRQVSAQQGQGFVSQVFYDELDPYGQWADYPNYGYVWIPEVGPDFSPYSTSGHWVMSEYGWAWASDYAWGWAPFHYGRWDFDDYYGWFWVPDNQWGPAWVTWRNANGYYGWTPMRPGISVNMSFDNGYRDVNRWNFVRYSDFGRPDIDRYYINRGDNDRIIRNSVVINNTFIDNRRNTTYIAGPPRGNVQRATGKKISSVVIRDYDRPGQMLDDNQLRIYRPPEERVIDQSQRPAPSKITNLRDVRPAGERNDANQRNVVAPTENNRREERQAQPRQQIDNRRREQQNQQVQPQEQIENRRQSQPQQEAQPSDRIEQQRIEQPQQQNEIKKQEQLRQPSEQQKQEVADPSVNRRVGRQQKTTDPSDKDKKVERRRR